MHIKTSQFRQYCQEKWFEHKDEILDWTGRPVDYDAAYYFRQHRWLLRRMYTDHLTATHKETDNGSV